MTPKKNKKPNAVDLTLDDLLAKNLRPLHGKRILVIGDLMLDRYLWGNVERTSPQAPVPVVHHERDGWVLGGAANVARNIAALGGRALLVSVVGKDADAQLLRECLKEDRISSAGLVVTPDRPTTVKMRVVSRGQELLRIDYEETSRLDDGTVQKLVRQVQRQAARADALILSDYAKGVLDERVIAAALSEARKNGIPIIADPKGQDYQKYRGVDVLTPNQVEVSLVMGRRVTNEKELLSAGRSLIRRCKLNGLIITRGPEGVAVMRPRRKLQSIPARAREVFDDTGAGDSFIAVLALCLAAGLSLEDAAAVANHAGGIVVGKRGVATVLPAELKAALSGQNSTSKVRTVSDMKFQVTNHQTQGRKVVFTNGCFDLLHPGHIQFLHEAKRLGDMLIVGLNTDRSVRAIKGPARPILGEDERAAILSALEVVDYIVFYDEETPEHLLRELKPDLLVKGRNIPKTQVVGRDIVESYGGKVKRLPILHQANVTDLLESIAGKMKKK